ncbi:hypothetical protein V9K67_21315 [Paraflavisolibacter sp. H34]|uniref:hypothetical protein n=1 Tax=Huijunlia imazamoxiresistens TaxID=3127457 RepID=UPI00301A6375
MKALRIAGYPLAQLFTFVLILISGEAFGGPYLVYLILALPHGGDYSVLGTGGILCLYICHKLYRIKRRAWVKPVLHLAGILLTLLSLYIFFINDRIRYNYGTFLQSVPLVTLWLFGISVLCGMVLAVIQLARLRINRHGFPTPH